MATLSAKRRAATKGRGTEPEPLNARRKGSQLPAFARAKLAVSEPGDPEEKQAERVADDVVKASRASGALHRESTSPGQEDALSAIAPPRRAATENSQQAPSARRSLRRASAEPGQEPPIAPLRRSQATVPVATPSEQETPARRPSAPVKPQAMPASGAPESDVKMLRRAPDQEEEASASEQMEPEERATEEEAEQENQSGPLGEGAASEAEPQPLDEEIGALRGGGAPLEQAVLESMQQSLGGNFMGVRIHTDAKAAELAERLSARAFTVGEDIFFAAGEYEPETEGGQHLLAHELTHVLQSDEGASRVFRQIAPPGTDTETNQYREGTDSANKRQALLQLKLPPVKHRHAGRYRSWPSLARKAAYRRNRPNQIGVWRDGLKSAIDDAAIAARFAAQSIPYPTSPSGLVRFRIGDREKEPTRQSMPRVLQIPDWDRQGREERTFQVDHIVELQVSGQDGDGKGNKIDNMELLNQRANGSSGAQIMSSIHTGVREYLATLNPQPGKKHWLETHTINFEGVEEGPGSVAASAARWWSFEEIAGLEPLTLARPAPVQDLTGDAGNFVLATGAGGSEMGRFAHSGLQFAPSPQQAGAIPGMVISNVSLLPAAEQGQSGADVGSLQARWVMPDAFTGQTEVTIPLKGVQAYCASLGPIPAPVAEFGPLSPLSLPAAEIRDGEPYAEGRIRPSLPLFENAEISVVLRGADITFAIEYSAEMVALPFPGITLDSGLISLFYSTENGFGAAGSLYFGIDRLGSGSFTAMVSQHGGFEASGEFAFDTELFDRARVSVWYREGAFGGEGEIGIDSPEKIRGIRSANLLVGFGEDEFHARGTVRPDIPGVQEASLRVGYSEEEGLTIGGTVELNSETPGIRSGSIDVTVRKQDEAWSVSASGTAVPDLPGIDSQLTVSYEDGAITAEFSGNYSRGMLSGAVEVGATNRTLDDQGQPTGEPGEEIIVYGGGEVGLQIAPWLQATAGIRFAPDGEVTVSGEIGLPSELEIFPRREIRRELLSIDIPIPIFPGIFAQIGGNLSVYAGIGAGVVDQLRLGVQYNPAREEETHITGDAHLNIPADAGLRLAVRAGIGLGIPAASVSGGLEIGGALGLQGAAEAGVHVDWTPRSGLSIDAFGRLSAQPKFRFDISGYVEVEALFFTIYEQRWELAAFEFGSDLTFGVRFPIEYREGQPFEISLDDVEFEVPEVNPRQLLGDLLDRIA